MGAAPALPLLLSFLVGSLAAQRPVQPVIGLVREIGSNGAPLADAEVFIGPRRTSTDAAGRFRIDSLAPSTYPLTIRRIGYRPVRSRIAVVAAEPTQAEYQMVPVPVLLPTLEVEGRRTGIYGVVGDTAFRALPGAKVSVLGVEGGEVYSDSLGRFDFPKARRGAYMVRVTRPGYTERRILVELEHGKGRELTFVLAPEAVPRFSPGGGAALFDLGRRLAFELQRSRMTRGEMQRYGSLPLCDVPRVRAMAGEPATVILNGVSVLREVSLCSWRSDEVEMVEFGSELRTGFRGDLPTYLRAPRSRSATARRGGSYLILWEKQ